MHFQTHVIHAGHEVAHSPHDHPSTPAIERAASWSYPSMHFLDSLLRGAEAGYFYGRDGSPTVQALEAAITAIEGGDQSLAFGSGMAAIASVLAVAGSGKRILATPDLYGRTYFLLTTWMVETGAEVRFLDAQDDSDIGATLQAWQPQLLVTETLSNPLVKVSRLHKVIALAHTVGCQVLVDNTFASPYLCQPAQLGADFTVESLTKYINGHGDVVGGSVTTLEAENYARLGQYRNSHGNILDPAAAWLTLRGIRTLALRMRQHTTNAALLADFLASHPAVRRVHYPGLPSHPGHQHARDLFDDRGFGGMLAFDLALSNRAAAWRVMERLKLALRAPTLGDIATLVSYPAHASHAALSVQEREALGIGEGLIRVSVGLEHADDIIADFAQALDPSE